MKCETNKKGTHEKGEGSTNRAILRGLELFSVSYRTESGGHSSSSLEFNKLSSSIVIFVEASSTKLFLLFTLFNLSELKIWTFLQKGVMGCSLKVPNLIELLRGFEEEEEEEEGERKGGEREEYI